MNRHKFEWELSLPVKNFLQSRQLHVCDEEMQFCNHSIDVYAYSSCETSTIAVELKLRNWRRAFVQALLYQLCCDYVYVALPQHTMEKVDLDLFADNGIGIIGVTYAGCCYEAFPASKSDVITSQHRNSCINRARDI